MKKFTAFLLALATVLTVVACSKSGDEIGTDGSSADNTSVMTESADTTEDTAETPESISADDTSETEETTEGETEDDSGTESETVATKNDETSSTQTPVHTSKDETSKTPTKTESNTPATSGNSQSSVTTSTPVNTTKPVETTQSTTTAATEPVVSDTPAEPAPSYQIKSNKKPGSSEDYNTPKVSKSRIKEGAGPLTSSEVYVGSNDFMFLGETVGDYTGTNLYRDSKLQRLADMMNDRYEWAEQNGIELYFVLCPNKATVYSEYVPVSLDHALYTRADQVVDYLTQNSSVPVIDLREPLIAAKAQYGDSLFYKYDTHWTQHAGFVAYSEIMKRVTQDKPNAVTYTKDSFNVNYYETYMKDLAYYLGYYSAYYSEGPVYSLKVGPDAELVSYQNRQAHGQFVFAYRWPNGYREDFTFFKFASKNTNAPKLYMLRDSFSIALVPFMKESFAESTYDWSRDFSRSKILESGADVVIIQVVEKSLDEVVSSRTFRD